MWEHKEIVRRIKSNKKLTIYRPKTQKKEKKWKGTLWKDHKADKFLVGLIKGNKKKKQRKYK